MLTMSVSYIVQIGITYAIPTYPLQGICTIPEANVKFRIVSSVVLAVLNNHKQQHNTNLTLLIAKSV